MVIPRTAVPNVTIVDSGGYETTDFQDLSTTFVQSLQKLPWSEANLKAVYDGWSKNVPAVFVGFDRRGSVATQVAKSHALLKKYPDQLHTILVKPNTAKARFIQMSDVLANITSFAHFHFVGFTEKELGSSSLRRMVNISKKFGLRLMRRTCGGFRFMYSGASIRSRCLCILSRAPRCLTD